jgi:O-antigen ligase
MKISSSTEPIADPTPLLFLVPAIAILLWPDAVGTTALVLAGAIFIPLIVYWFSQSPAAAIIALVVASAIPRLYVEILGLKARPEHIVGGLLLCATPFLLKKRRQPVRWMAVDYLLVAYIALNIISSAFMSVQPSQTIKWAIQQALVILPYFFLRVLVTDRAGFQWAFRVLLAVAAASAGYAIFGFCANLLFGIQLGVDLDQYNGIPATYGLQYEGNILAAYCGALTVMMLTMYVLKRRRGYVIGYASLGLAGMAISLSRAALGATVIGLASLLLWASWRRLLDRQIVFKIALASLLVALALAPILLPFYTERFATVDVADVSQDPNTALRLVQVAAAADNIAAHPILGNGTASFQLSFSWDELGIQDWEGGAWLSNTETRVLHDTGILGLGVFTAFLLGLLFRSWKTLKRETSPELLALLFSAVVYVISFQVTEGTLLAFSWVHLGLIGCAVSYLGNHQDKENGTPLAQIISG